MIDTHSHILPYLDDGSRSWEESLKMAALAAEDGVTEIICTPHYVPGTHDTSPDSIKEKILELQAKVNSQGTRVHLYAGQEIQLLPNVVNLLKDGLVLTMAESSYVLLELPPHFLPVSLDTILWQLRSEGYYPIITHPERHPAMLKNPDYLEKWIHAGAYIQITAASLRGSFGRRIAKLSWQLINRNLVHLIATDAHDLKNRSPRLRDVRNIIVQRFGESYTEFIFERNPSALLRNEPLERPVSSRRSKKKSWSFLSWFCRGR